MAGLPVPTKETMVTKYTGKSNYGKLKVDFLYMLFDLTEPELYTKCKELIWLSAYANNNPKSDYHWQCDACYDECHRRKQTQLYTTAWNSVSKSCN